MVKNVILDDQIPSPIKLSTPASAGAARRISSGFLATTLNPH